MVKKKYEKEISRSVTENSDYNYNRSKFKKCVIKLCKINGSAASSNSKASEYKDPLRKANKKSSDDNMLLQKKNSIHPTESDSTMKASRIKPTLVRLRKINDMKQANHGNNSNISNGKLNHGEKQRVLVDPKLNQHISTKENMTSRSNVQLQPGQSIFSKNKVLNKTATKISANKSNSLGIDNECDDVYDFPSESTVSEQEDPAIDVVKKLIEEGKASVARHKRFPTKKKTRRRAQRAPRNYNKNIKEIEKRNIKNVELGFSEIEFFQQKRSPILRIDGDQLQKPVKLITDSTEDTPKGITKRQAVPRRALITDKMKLLGVAKNLVSQSTPLNKKNVSKPNNHLSPIYISSPWRPPDERTLPRVFYFSRNEDDLPSYSSDVIPSSQTGNEKNISKPNHTGRGYTSMDLSNIENIAPGDAINKTDTQNPDAQKILQHRSPLKTINILEIINLPNRAKVAEKHTTQKPQELSCRLPISDSAGQRNADNNNKTDTDLNNINVNNMTIENCFGFDDVGEAENLETYKAIPSKNQLQRKLKNLKRLLPPKPTRISYGRIRTIFAEEPKQKDIREMLTSTRIESRYKNKPKEDFLPEFEDSINLSLNEEENNTIEGLQLFNDPDEPKITFDSSAHCRTYTRIPKRRRKLQNNSFFFYDDESEEEIEEQEKSPAQKKKRTKPIDKKADEELSHFVEDFNSMCQEVEQYQLQVE